MASLETPVKRATRFLPRRLQGPCGQYKCRPFDKVLRWSYNPREGRPTEGDDLTVLPPTPAQVAALAAYMRLASQKAAARERGVSIQTFRNHLTGLYQRLEVTNAIEAATALGWVHPPMATGGIASADPSI